MENLKTRISGDGEPLSGNQDCVYALHVINDLLTDLVNADDSRPDGESAQHGYHVGGLLAAQKVLISLLTTTIGGM